jgi:hypothetical protein
VNQPLATLRKARCAGGSISMIVFMPARPEDWSASRMRRWSSSSTTIPWLFTNVSGRFEMSQMSACLVIAQKDP